jgi:hypothetical protein
MRMTAAKRALADRVREARLGSEPASVAFNTLFVTPAGCAELDHVWLARTWEGPTVLRRYKAGPNIADNFRETF